MTMNVTIQADEQPTTTDPAANHYERSDTVTMRLIKRGGVQKVLAYQKGRGSEGFGLSKR